MAVVWIIWMERSKIMFESVREDNFDMLSGIVHIWASLWDSIYSVLGIASFLLFVSTGVQQFINSIVLVLGVSSFCIWCFCWMSCPLRNNFFLINIFLNL